MTVESITIVKPAVGAPEGHDQKMIDLVDKANAPTEPEITPEQQGEDRPQWLDKKFNSPEELAKAYAELERKLGSKEAPAPEPEKPAAEPEKAEAELAKKGLNLQDFSQEFSRNGELSEDSYKKLAEAGYDRDLVDTYIEGQRARATQYESQIKTEAGGEENYIAMTDWAKANLSPDEITAYNDAVSSGNVAQAKLAVAGLAAQYTKAVGSEPKLFGGKQANDSGDVFESIAQVTEAMKDPRYQSDPAYRNKVQAKLSRSNVF